MSIDPDGTVSVEFDDQAVVTLSLLGLSGPGIRMLWLVGGASLLQELHEAGTTDKLHRLAAGLPVGCHAWLDHDATLNLQRTSDGVAIWRERVEPIDYRWEGVTTRHGRVTMGLPTGDRGAWHRRSMMRP